MNILFIGELDEFGVKMAYRLSLLHNVVAVSKERSIYELDFEWYPYNNDAVEGICVSHNIDTVFLFNVSDAQRAYSVLTGMFKNEICHINNIVWVVENEVFRKRSDKNDIYKLICRNISEQFHKKTLVIFTSSLYSDINTPDYIDIRLLEIISKNKLNPSGASDDYCDCIHIDDLILGISNILNETDSLTLNGTNVIELESAYPFFLHTLIDVLSDRYKQVTVLPYENTVSETKLEFYKNNNWSPEHSFINEFPSLLDNKEIDSGTLRKQRFRKHISKVLTVLPILLLFILTESYMQFISVSSELQFVDMRLLLIVFVGLFYGKKWGLCVSALCSISSVVQGLLNGYKWFVLFYNVNNWIPIVVYMITAMITGIIHDNKIISNRIDGGYYE